MIKTGLISATGTTPSGATGISKPVPMKLYATWEVDRTPSNCIPRLCSFTLTRLIVLRPLGSELSSISIAVKMESSKRILRSNELTLPANGLLDTSLDWSFSLQYPHFLKRDGNRLQVLLQRRKRYKNRTMLGFKTLAEGVIRMDQVLQKQMDIELELVSDTGTKGDKCSNIQTVAKLTVLQLSSTPVDQDQKGTMSILAERTYSDDEEEGDFSSGEEEGQDMSDSEPIRSKLPHARHNFKQRFVSLLRRFRAADSEGSRAALGATSDIQALFNELNSLSCDEDSAGEQEDTLSISSTPKPSLRPFFSSSRSLLDASLLPEQGTDRHTDEKNQSGSDGNADICWTDHEAQSDPQTNSPPRDKDKENVSDRDRKSRLFRTNQSASVTKKKHSLSINMDSTKPFEVITTAPGVNDSTAPRKSFLATLSRTLPLEDISLPDCVALVDGSSALAKLNIIPGMSDMRLIQVGSSSECKFVLQTLLNKIHKFCNSSAKPPVTVRVLIIGGDLITTACVRFYVELLSSRSPDWQAYLRFYIVPIGNNCIARHLWSLDSSYASLFPSDISITDRTQDEIMSRLQRYITPSSPPTVQLPLAEAMLTCHDESSQLFIPFITEVRVGTTENVQSMSVEIDDGICLSQTPSSIGASVPSSGGGTTPAGMLSSSPPAPPVTPPSSPNVQVKELTWESLELQLDYWQVVKSGDTNKNRPEGKNSLKGTFRSIYVSRQPGSPHLSLTVHFLSKEKKQKIMRLGKKKEKDKENEARSQTIEGISRLICSAKTSHSSPLKVYIDGMEWSGVKFFQLSSTWQTHIKQFNVALVGAPLADSELT